MTSPTLDELIGEDPGVAHACREIEREEERLETMRHLGQAIWDMIAAKHGPDFANAFTNALHAPTKPGTPERRFQDRCTEILPARLDKMTAEFRS